MMFVYGEECMDSLKYCTEALRFRKRDAFVLVVPKNHMVILKTKA